MWLLFKVRREEEEEQRHASCQLIGSYCPAGQPASLSTWTFQVFNIEHQRLIRNITRQIWITLRQTQTAFFFFIFQLTWNKDLWAITFLCKGSVPMCQNLLIWTGNLYKKKLFAEAAGTEAVEPQKRAALPQFCLKGPLYFTLKQWLYRNAVPTLAWPGEGGGRGPLQRVCPPCKEPKWNFFNSNCQPGL